MKGMFFTIVTFLIFFSVMSYVYIVVNNNIESTKFVAEEISAQRIYYSWKDVSEDINSFLEVSLSKDNNILQINDTLPSIEDIASVLDLYQGFVEQIYEDPTIDIDFEDLTGSKTNLSDIDPQSLFTIEPMNIEYKYPDFGKNQLFIEVDPTNFSFIERIDLIIEVPGYFNISTSPNPKECPATYCLNYSLTVTNSTHEWVYPYMQLDVDFNAWITIDVGAAETAIRINTGDINPGNTVLNLDIIKSDFNINTTMDIEFNTSDFYINLPTILNVSTPFGKKVDKI